MTRSVSLNVRDNSYAYRLPPL